MASDDEGDGSGVSGCDGDDDDDDANQPCRDRCNAFDDFCCILYVRLE